MYLEYEVYGVPWDGAFYVQSVQIFICGHFKASEISNTVTSTVSRSFNPYSLYGFVVLHIGKQPQSSWRVM